MAEEKKEQERDLGRMQRLLDGLNENMSEQEKLKQKKYKTLCDSFNDKDNINFDSKDFCMMLNNHGKISGYSNLIKIEEIFDDIVAHVDIEEMQTAKAIVFIYFANENVSMFAIGDLMERIHDILPKGLDIYFTVNTANNINVDYAEYRVIMTGLKPKDNIQEKFNYFVIDNYSIKINDRYLILDKSGDFEITQFFEIEKIDGIVINKNSSDEKKIIINILTNGNTEELIISNNERNKKTFNNMTKCLMKYKRILEHK